MKIQSKKIYRGTYISFCENKDFTLHFMVTQSENSCEITETVNKNTILSIVEVIKIT
jgi:imidazoleglycerol phosphate dehydratase HisB